MQKTVFWSASGAVGKSSLALACAGRLAQRGFRVLLVDLDLENPGLHLNLALASPPAGVAALVRLANQNRLTESEFERLSIRVNIHTGKLVLIPGLSTRTRSAEISAEGLLALFKFLEADFDWLIVDAATGFLLSESPTRANSFAQFVSRSDCTVLVSNTEPAAISRLVANWHLLKPNLPEHTVLVVNRVREGVLGKTVRQQITETFERLLNLSPALLIGDHSKEFDQAIRTGSLLEHGSKSTGASGAVESLVGLILNSPGELQLRVAKLG